MSGFAKNGVLYPAGIYAIDDNSVSPNTGWSSKKVMDKLASVKSIIRVDAKPTYADGTITYVKDGTSYTTTDHETWFYYVVDDELYKTIFIDGVEYTKADSSVDFDEFVAKTDIVTTIDDTVTDEQVPSAKEINNFVNRRLVSTVSSVDEVNSTDRSFQTFTIPSTISESVGLPISPKSSWFAIHCSHAKNYKYPTQIAFEYAGAKRIMVRFCVNGTWSEWRKIYSTSVPDVPKTNVSSKLINATMNSGGVVYYSVKNGICNVQIASLNASTSGAVIFPNGSFPKMDVNNTNGHYPVTSPNATCGLLVFANNGAVRYYGNPVTIYATISYPVADDWRP